MRVTNKMIMNNAASNINSTKEMVNKRNTQMTTQKKISKPSEDPVIAVRSLRLSTSLSIVNQYYQKNIPDATSWLDVTETALTNMRSIVSDCRQLAVTGSTDTYNETDRNTMLDQLKALQEQLYAEGNSDYAGRTVFTGYRTDRNLTFTENETTTAYDIAQVFSVEESMEEHRYYSGNVVIPTTKNELVNEISDTQESAYYRIRLAYDDINIITASSKEKTESMTTMLPQYETTIKASYEAYAAAQEAGGAAPADTDETLSKGLALIMTGKDGTAINVANVHVYKDEKSWEEWGNTTFKKTDDAGQVLDPVEYELRGKYVADDEIAIIQSTGEIIFGKTVAEELMKTKASVSISYSKTGFDSGELRPEYYYNCIKTDDMNEGGDDIIYTKFDDFGDVINFDIQYTIAAGQTININTEASNVFDSSLQRDLGEMIDAIAKTLSAHQKVDKLKAMKDEAQYATDDDQKRLEEWIAGAQKEADYADDNMQKLFNTELGKIDNYYAKINLGLTDLGCKTDSLKLTKARVGDQQETVQELQSTNDDIDLSQIIIDYTAAYTAYQSSLQAAGKLSESTLLNYI